MALKRHLQSILAVLSFSVGRAGPASTSRTTQTPHVRPRQSSNSVAAVPAPLPLGAAVGGGHGVYVPVQLVGGLQHAHSSAGSLWAWVVAAGGAIHGVRQSHEARHTRRNRNHLVPQAHMHAEDGWQTASEDEGTWTRQTSEAPMHHMPQMPEGATFLGQPMGMNYAQQAQPFNGVNGVNGALDFSPVWPNQMMPLVMVAMPQDSEPQAQVQAASDASSSSVAQAPFAPGQLERVTTSTASESSWASAASSRWTSRDCDWTNKQLMKPDCPQRRELLRQVIQDSWNLANSKNGTRLVQTALDVADYQEKQLLASSFQGRVWVALKSPHANHVLQKIVALMPPEKMQFVIDELTGRVAEAARHPFGCRVLERLLEHCSSEQNESILREVVSDVVELSKHAYGNYVVQHLLEHGSQQQRHQLLQQLICEAKRMARHKVASHVIESALVHAAHEDRQQLKAALAESVEALQSLSASNYGSFVYF